MPARSHGLNTSPVYCTWENMINRCRRGNVQNSRRKKYQTISVCERWQTFENFLEDMGNRPAGKSLDRKDNSKGYFKENCRWATPGEQNRNHSRNILITFNGKTQCRKDWAREIGISEPALTKRLSKWPVEKALTQKKQGT
jgi:hypothetical protein